MWTSQRLDFNVSDAGIEDEGSKGLWNRGEKLEQTPHLRVKTNLLDCPAVITSISHDA